MAKERKREHGRSSERVCVRRGGDGGDERLWTFEILPNTFSFADR